MKFNSLEKITQENPKLEQIIKKYKDEYHEILDDLVGSPEDLSTLEQMAYDAAIGSSEMQEAWKQVLTERNEERRALHKDLVVDHEGKLVKRSDYLSGEMAA